MIKDQRIQELILKLQVNSEPKFVPVYLEEYSEPLNCYINVERKMKEAGGKIHYGWHIHTKQLFIEAEHHAVWENEEGNLICVTPNQDNKTEILYIIDDSKIWTGTSIGNVRINATTNEIVEDLIKIWEGIDLMYALLPRLDDKRLTFEPTILTYISGFEQTQNKYYEYITSGFGINDECLCGSNKKYIDCHKILLPFMIDDIIKEAKEVAKQKFGLRS